MEEQTNRNQINGTRKSKFLKVAILFEILLVVAAVAGALYWYSGGSFDFDDDESSEWIEDYQAVGGPKLLMLGIDGASWKIVNRLIKEGKMPNLEKIISEGVRATPTTLNPTISPMIWTTIATGREPWKHGIRNFVSLTDQSYSERLVGSDTRRGKAIWNILSEQGNKVGVFSYWATWPAEEIHGFTVTDLALIDPEKGISPTSLRDFITFTSAKALGLSALINWPKIDLPVPTGHNDPVFFKAAHDSFQLVEKLFVANSLALFDKETPDVLVQVDGMTDATQHLFTKFLYPDQFSVPIDKELVDKYGGFIDEIFISQDKMFGEYLERAGDNTNIIILSDHGFFLDPAAGDRFSGFNVILEKLGYLTYFADGSIDYSKTKAFECNNNSFDWQRRLCINSTGKYPSGIVPQSEFFSLRSKIIKDLENLKTDQGINLLTSVLAQDGAESDVFYDIRRTVSDQSVVIGTDVVPLHYLISVSVESGNHYSDPVGPDGIFVWRGPNVKKGVEVEIDYVDVLPNILYALGLAIPKDMDGQFRPDIFVNPKAPSYIETYETNSQTILGLLTQGTEGDDRAVFEEGKFDIISNIKSGDQFDQFCVRPANPKSVTVQVEKLERTEGVNKKEVASFRSMPFSEIPKRDITHISFSDLQFQTIDKDKYGFIFPVGDTEQSSLGLWTNLFFDAEIEKAGELYIVAQGVPSGGVYPELQIEQSGKVQTILVDSDTAHTYHVPIYGGRARLSYNNDSLVVGEDRNLIIKEIYTTKELIVESLSESHFYTDGDNLCFTNSSIGTTELSVQLISDGHNNPTQIEAQDEAIRLLNEIGEL